MNAHSSDPYLRRGKIEMSKNFIFNPDEQILSVLFGQFFPFAIEPNNNFQPWDNFVYFGYSPLFRIVLEGEVIPMYDVIFTMHPDGSLSLVFNETKNPSVCGT